MLTKRDLRVNYFFFKLASVLNLIPVTFDPLTGRMRAQSSSIRKFIFKCWQALGLYTFTFLFSRTFYSLTYTNLSLDFIPVMGIGSTAFCCAFLAAHFMFDTNLEENIKVYNEIMRIRGKDN